jgi:DNA-directed RNA polymerase I, II, and III subunit RPABC2
MEYSDRDSSSDSDNDSYVKSTKVKKYPEDVDVDDVDDFEDDDDDMYDEYKDEEKNEEKDEEKDKILNQFANNEDGNNDVDDAGDNDYDDAEINGLKDFNNEEGNNEEDEDEDEEDDDGYLQKFNNNIAKNILLDFHPECKKHNYDEISKLTQVTRDAFGIICNDPFHKTNPFLTIYEKARILGQRATQINSGSLPMVKIPETMIDSQLIAELELEQKKIPFIIKRTVPGGCVEYWKVSDLENIHY